MSDYVSGIISFLCLVVIIIVSVLIVLQSNKLKHDVKRTFADVINQINDSQYYAYTFDKNQEQNLKNVDLNLSIVDKKAKDSLAIVKETSDKLKADIDKLRKESLTVAGIAGGVPAVKTDKLDVNGNIGLPSNGAGVIWGGKSKIYDNGGNTTIASDKTIALNAPNGVTVNGGTVVLSDYEQFSKANEPVEKAGNWTLGNDWPWDKKFRGGRVGYAHTQVGDDNDSSAYWIEYAVPAGMKQAYVVHLPWVNCRYFDVMGKIGNDVIFIKRVNSWHPQYMTLANNKGSWEVDGTHAGTTAVSVAGVNRFERIRIQCRIGQVHLMGVGWTMEEGRAMETGYTHWDNVYSKPDMTNPTFSNIKANGDLFVGMNRNTATGGTIYIGGTEGDNAHDHTVIEGRNWGGSDKSELLLFKGNDPLGGCNGTCGPDRIRLRAAEIDFDVYSDYTTDRKSENIVAKVTPGKLTVDGGLQTKNNIVQGLGESHDDWTGANFKRRDGRWTHFDWVGDQRNYIRGDTSIDGNASVARHLDASVDWVNGGDKALFAGWFGRKVVLGNNNNGKHDYARDSGLDQVVATNKLHAAAGLNVQGDLCIGGTCISEANLKKLKTLGV